MAVFQYQAVESGASVSGTIVADTPRQARDELRGRGLTVLAVDRAAERTGKTARAGRLKDQAEVVAFLRRTATLLKAGIPLLSALNTLAEQHRGRFRVMVQEIADEVASGVSLAEAMRLHGRYFDELCVSVVEVGENTGSLEDALNRLAAFKDKAHRLRSRVATAMTYPAVVMTIGLAVTLFLMTYVVPNLLATLVQSGKDLPAITRAVKSASDFLVNWWWALLGALAGLALLIRLVRQSGRGRVTLSRALLRVPALGDLIRKENTSRMAVVMAALLRSGVQFTEAIRITRRTLTNPVFAQAMESYEAAVAAGADVAGPLKASGVFSPMVVQMLAVGQQSGELEEMLDQLADAYDREVDAATTRFTRLLEPLMIVILAVLVGFIALATVLPILEASNVL